jgi:hypothetical protein
MLATSIFNLNLVCRSWLRKKLMYRGGGGGATFSADGRGVSGYNGGDEALFLLV